MGLLFGLALTVGTAACGREVPQGGVLSPSDLARAPRVVRRLGVADALPRDLDLVVRVDVARMRSQLGPVTAAALSARAIDRTDDDLLLGAMSQGDVVWLGLRVSDLTRGDRVIVVEGRFAGFEPDPTIWSRSTWSPSGARIFDRIDASARGTTSRIILLHDRALAFVTSVEVDSVARVLRAGPDKDRGDPSAEGLLSLDLRRCQLPAELEQRFASLGALARGLGQVRATANLDDEGLRVDAELRALSTEAAERVYTFLDALRSEEGGGRLAAQVRGGHVGWPKLERVDQVVHLNLIVPRALLLSALTAEP